jgi:uncharacterized protein (DUF2141 family)
MVMGIMPRGKPSLILATLVPLLLVLAAAAPAGAPIEVAVSGVREAKGNVHVDICVEKLFLTSDCPYIGIAQARVGTTIVTVENVPPGRYAAQAFHDRNGNGKVDRGLFGIPKEAVGFSNDAPTPMRAPHFDDAAFDHGDTPQHIGFTLRHLIG